jgi:RimJ/RimL family protein N-acetyltransferase
MLGLIGEWGFGTLGLERIELRIDVENIASERVAERAGFTREGVLRSVAFKEGLRADVAVWSRLRSDR